MSAGPDESRMCYFWTNSSSSECLSLYLRCARSSCPRNLCRPCSHFVVPNWDRALRCDWAAAPPHGHALGVMACRIQHSRSKSSIRSPCSSGLDTGGGRGKEADCESTFSFSDAGADARVQPAGRGDTSEPRVRLKSFSSRRCNCSSPETDLNIQEIT